MAPNKHLICLAQSHLTLMCFSQECSPSLLSRVQFFLNVNCSGTSAQEDSLLFHRKDKGCVHLQLQLLRLEITEKVEHRGFRPVNHQIFLPHKTLLFMKERSPGAKMTEKRIGGERRGEIKNDSSLLCNSQQEIRERTISPLRENESSERKVASLKTFLGVSDSKEILLRRN